MSCKSSLQKILQAFFKYMSPDENLLEMRVKGLFLHP